MNDELFQSRRAEFGLPEAKMAETETTVPADGLTVSGETISETTEVDSNESLAACVADAV